MISELFLICAMNLPPMAWNGPPRVKAIQMMDREEQRLRDWIHKNNPDADIFIYPNPQEETLKENGYERVPFTWRGNQIWIKRKPQSDKKMRVRVATSA